VIIAAFADPSLFKKRKKKKKTLLLLLAYLADHVSAVISLNFFEQLNLLVVTTKVIINFYSELFSVVAVFTRVSTNVMKMW